MLSTKAKNLKGTWRQALVAFFGPLFLIFAFRWFLFEPFVIPSGSMIPTLLVHDHIFVKKFSFGFRIPYVDKLIIQWSHPQRGEIVVFKYPQNPNVYFVKRVAAIGGDEFYLHNGKLFVNGQSYLQELVPVQEIGKTDDFESFDYYIENNHYVRYQAGQKEMSEFAKVRVPEGHFFVVGDNRDQSSDSRFWGFVPEDNLVGKASMIWLSCDETLPTASFLCDPKTIRLNRMFKFVK